MIPLRSQLEEIELGVCLRYKYSEKLTLFGEVTGRVASDFVSLNSNDLGIGGRSVYATLHAATIVSITSLVSPPSPTPTTWLYQRSECTGNPTTVGPSIWFSRNRK